MKKYYVDNECMADFLFMYCEGKSFLWQAYFGWRGSYKRGNYNYWYFIVPERIFNLAKKYAHKYDDFEIVGEN